MDKFIFSTAQMLLENRIIKTNREPLEKVIQSEPRFQVAPDLSTMLSPYEKVMESKNFLPFHLDHLTPRMVEVAREELNESEETRTSAIEQMRKLITKEKNLKCRMDDEFLLQFLRARKFDAKNAFTRLQTLYQVTSRTSADFYANIDDELAKKAFGSGFGSHLPYRDREGAAVVLHKMGNWKVEDAEVTSIMNCCFAVLLSAVDYPATQVCGLQILVDVKGTSLAHMRCLSPRILNIVSKGLRDMLPIRFKGIHLVNTSSIFRYLWGIVTIFLSKKMKDRIHIHDGNMETLHEFIPKEILPSEYGGDNPDFDPVEQGSAELEKFLPKYLQIIHDGYVKN